MAKKSKHPSKHHRQQGPVRAKKHLGQHFLKDTAVAERIAETLSMNGYSHVIEVGPGTGVLTQFLLQKNIELVVMDLDSESITYLKEHFFLDHFHLQPKKEQLTIIEGDFLKYNLSTLFGGRPYAITGNFPYNISTQIVFKMLENKEQVPEFTGMFQKEVAERICTTEGSKTYGILSVLAQAFYEAEYLFTVGPEVFDPPPKVQSGVLRLRRRSAYQLDCDEALFFRVVKTAFNQRRKTLRNSLKAFVLSDNLKEDAIFDRRPEQLSVPEFLALTKRIAHDSV